jgi:hypothetical protein
MSHSAQIIWLPSAWKARRAYHRRIATDMVDDLILALGLALFVSVTGVWTYLLWLASLHSVTAIHLWIAKGFGVS